MNCHELKGIDGANPLGFLAAMGMLRVATLRDSAAKLGWCVDVPAPYPLLHTSLSQEALAQAVCEEGARVAEAVKKHGEVIKCSPIQYRESCAEHMSRISLPGELSLVDYFSAFASDAATEKGGYVLATGFSFSNGGGGQFLLKDFAALVAACGIPEIVANVFRGEGLSRICTNLNWDPSALRNYALRWKDPEKTEKLTNVPLHVLAFLGLALFPSVPYGSRLVTTGFDARGKTLKWPIWSTPAGYRTVASMLVSNVVGFAGVRYYASQRFSSNKRLYFTPAAPV